jgi:glycosyltransferase involved in cell wall biosynthesis
MRVVLANKFLHLKGGAERAVLVLGAELGRRGHEVHYFGMAHPENAVAGSHVTLVASRDYHQGGWRGLGDAAAMLYSPGARRRMAELLDRVHPHVVHLHNVYHQLTPSILDAVRERGVPAVMTVHDYKLVCPRYDMLRAAAPCGVCVERGPTACLRHRCAEGSWGRSLLLAAEAVVHRARGSYDAVRLFLAPSRFVLAVLGSAGFAPERLRYLPNFALATQPAPPPVTPAADRFVYAGRLSREKGIETLVRAACRLRRGRLVVCGTGSLAPRLRALAEAAPPGRVELRGHLPAGELAAEIAAASFTTAPSEWFENAPFAVLESMAQGRAVLASRIGGLPELVQDGATGELVPPGDVPAWTAALERAVADPERMRRLGEGARALAATRHALEEHVSHVEGAYREVGA